MSDETGPGRRTNFSEGPAPRGRSLPRPTGPAAKPAGGAASVLNRLPVPMPVAIVGTVLVLVITAVLLVKVLGSDSASADKVDTPPPSTAPPATAPVPSPATSPLPTRSPAESDFAARLAFLETMKRMGLTQKQADCAADRVQATLGWSQLSETLMDPGKPGQLEQLMIACVKG